MALRGGGVALGSPHRKVIGLIGDGSSMCSIQGLWSAADLGVPLTYIIVNNSRYEALVNFGHVFGLQETVGTALPGLDFVALAQGQGLAAERVSDPATLDDALARAFAADTPNLQEIIVQ